MKIMSYFPLLNRNFNSIITNAKYVLVILILLISANTFAQIGIGTKTPAPSAALEVTSSTNNKGILIPRITATQKDAIASPAQGLLVYQTTAPTGFYYYTGGAWKLMAIQTDLAGKVDKVDGKDLSTNDYTTAEKTKLAAITGTNTGDQTTITGNAGTATKLATARNINGVAFDGSADITIAVAADAATITGIIPIANGGTGQTTVPGILSTLGFASNNIAIGFVAGTPNQGVNAGTIAIGGGAGRENQGAASVAIGYVSGDQNQGSASVAIGPNAAQSGQGTQAVALGYAAGQNGQGAYSVAVGSFAGNSQAANSIALNATGASLNPSTTGFFVDPIINRAATSTALYYNTTTKEVTSGTAVSGGVPYTGATGAVNLGNYDLTVNGVTAGMGSGNLGFNTVFGRGALSSTALINGGNYNLATGYVALQSNTTGSFNTATGTYSLLKNITGNNNTGYGVASLFENTTGNNNTAIGYEADVVSNNLSNATAIGYGAKVSASDNIQLGNTSVSNVKTSGTLTAGTVTYPKSHNSTDGQVLTTNASGVASWATPASSSSSSPTYTLGLNTDLGGYVFFLSSDSKHGLVAETQDQSTSSTWYNAQDNISNQVNHSTDAKKFTDWRLPTKHELNLMYIARSSVGNLLNGDYWSSVEIVNSVTSATPFAWSQSFDGGGQGNTLKGFTSRVRAVRAF